MNWLKRLLKLVWKYTKEKNREEVLSQAIKQFREQTKSVTSNRATGLKIINPPYRGNIKIKKKGKINEKTK